MPGPKMGARPSDFDEQLVRESPTFKKWLSLPDGQKIRYACRDFIKGHGDDEERLMRRIMIARRNNLRDHEILKQARAQVVDQEGCVDGDVVNVGENNNNNDDNGSIRGRINEKRIREKDGSDKSISNKKRKNVVVNAMTDDEIRKEMDVPAVEATRSYKTWLELPDGHELTYNQTYIKGKEGHDWLLRKNIWRRMRYRRQNKAMVEKLKQDIVNDITVSSSSSVIHTNNSTSSRSRTSQRRQNLNPSPPPLTYNSHMGISAALTATQIVDQTLLSTTGTDADSLNLPTVTENADSFHADAVEAAVAAAESYVKQARESEAAAELLSAYNAENDLIKVEDHRSRLDGENVSSTIASSVHNPIISDERDSGDDHHTANTLVDYDGDALDVAAKLAAAASASNGDGNECVDV